MGRQGGRVVPHLRDAGGDIAPRFVLFAVVLLAINFRSVIASLPPLLPDIRRDLDMSAAAAGLLTALPVLSFGAPAPLAPALARRRPIEAVLVACAVLAAAGAAVRGLSGVGALFAGALLAGGAVAVAQTAVPGFMRSAHAHATGRLMGAYSMALPLGATVGALAAVPLAQAANDSWRLLAGLLGASGASRCCRVHPSRPLTPATGVAPFHAAAVVAAGLAGGGVLRPPVDGVLRGTRVVSRDPAGLRMVGRRSGSPSGAGQSPVGGARLRRSVPGRAGVAPRRLLISVVVLAGGGVAGLLAWPAAAPVWMVAVGLGQGGLLGLGLMLPTLAATDAEDVTRLTLATFTGGYLIAAVGPSLCGLAHDATGGWEVPLLGVLAVTLATLAPGFRATRAPEP